MPFRLNHRRFPLLRIGLVLTLLVLGFCTNGQSESITNLSQLTQAVSALVKTNRAVDIEVTVCAASRPEFGVLIVQDETGVELLQLGDLQRAFLPGERIQIRHGTCLLRRREMGIELCPTPVADNDGLHSPTVKSGELKLPSGKIPIRLDWFNYQGSFALDVSFANGNKAPHAIPSSNLWHAVITETGQTNFLPGLSAECFEGTWSALPDFNLLPAVKIGVVENFDPDFRIRKERVGVRYSGYLEVPREARHRFVLRSDDGAMLFLGESHVPVVSLGSGAPPTPQPARFLDTGFLNLDERRWTAIEGRVGFATRENKGVRFDLGDNRQVISVQVADATGLDIAQLLNARIRVTGIARGALASDQTIVLGRLFAASAKDLVFLEGVPTPGELVLPLTSVSQVQNLPIERARRGLPVRLRGTVTGAKKTSHEQWMSFQDDVRGVFVNLAAVFNAAPEFSEFWEIEGRTGAGNFAPIVVAQKLRRLGEGMVPTPVKPTWTELLNGSRDVQWAELEGLVTEVRSNTISLHLPEGQLDVELENHFDSTLRQFIKAVVKIRGVLYAQWNPSTREVRVGRVMMRNSIISEIVPPPADPFDTVVRTPRELLLFDAQASALRPVKVRGQLVYTDSIQSFLQADGTGLRLLPIGKTDSRPGDLVEAVGYPDIGGMGLTLREVLLRKTGTAPLPAPKDAFESNLSRQNLNSTLVCMDGKLLGWHAEQGLPVLEMQSGSRLYMARLAERPVSLDLRTGSRLKLTGVYVGRRSDQSHRNDNSSFELLLNSQADIAVLSQPSWWTLPRLLALTGVLLVILIFTVIWNAQLRRLVEQRTVQLRRETRERELVERNHALETERSRIARDLHDDLGSSLTEINALAGTGQLPETTTAHQPDLFHAIGAKARSLISALDVIVWAVNPEDNSLQSLADYLSGYAEEFFSHANITCRFKVPISFPALTLEGRMRHDLLMAVKEALNNVVRHADATEAEFRMAMNGTGLEIDIADNGKGINEAPRSHGHGLKNLSERLQRLGGTCTVKPRDEGGTIVEMRLPLGGPLQPGRSQVDDAAIRRSSDF